MLIKHLSISFICVGSFELKGLEGLRMYSEDQYGRVGPGRSLFKSPLCQGIWLNHFSPDTFSPSGLPHRVVEDKVEEGSVIWTALDPSWGERQGISERKKMKICDWNYSFKKQLMWRGITTEMGVVLISHLCQRDYPHPSNLLGGKKRVSNSNLLGEDGMTSLRIIES